MWFLQKDTDSEIHPEKIAEMLKKYPGKVIVYVDKLHKKDELPELKTKKFIVPSEVIFTDFVHKHIHKKLEINPTTALFYFIGKQHNIPIMTNTIGEIYEKYKSDNNVLYIYYKSESVFG